VHALLQHLDHQITRLRSHAAASSGPSELCTHTASSELCAHSSSLLVNRPDRCLNGLGEIIRACLLFHGTYLLCCLRRRDLTSRRGI